jgi:selenocysteine lyase/cysteine desulfurase
VLSCDWDAVRAHEDALLGVMLAGLAAIDGVHVHGAPRDRTPTVTFSVAGRTPVEVASALAEARVAVWHGNFYAYELSRLLGLEPDGAVRAGIVHYNEPEDVERLLDAVAAVAGA